MGQRSGRRCATLSLSPVIPTFSETRCVRSDQVIEQSTLLGAQCAARGKSNLAHRSDPTVGQGPFPNTGPGKGSQVRGALGRSRGQVDGDSENQEQRRIKQQSVRLTCISAIVTGVVILIVLGVLGWLMLRMTG
jgi:hypothetical protein